MIRLIGPGDPRLQEAAGHPLILAAIQALAKTVGPGLRRELWLVEDEAEGTASGAVYRTEGGVFATAAGEDAVRETAAFLAMMGRVPATADRALARLMPGNWARFPVLRYQGEAPEPIPLCPPSVMELVDRNIAAGTVEKSARDELYAELHLRVRRGAAQVLLAPGENREPAAGACILLGQSCAVIGYLACPPEKQRHGYGTAALFAAVRAAMEARKIPLLACEEGLVSFYAKRGFVPAGEVFERRNTER